MDSALDNAPSIIEAAAQSTLGILALLVLTVGAIAYLFFRDSGDRVKVGVFSMIFVGAAGFGLAVVSAANPAGPTPTDSDETASTPPLTEGSAHGGGVVEIEEADDVEAQDVLGVEDRAVEPAAERTEITVSYLGDALGCALQLQVRIGDRTFQPENTVYRVSDVPTGPQPYEIGGVIMCALAGSCEASGAGTLDVRPNANYNVVWQSTDYAVCDVVLQRGS